MTEKLRICKQCRKDGAVIEVNRILTIEDRYKGKTWMVFTLYQCPKCKTVVSEPDRYSPMPGGSYVS